MTTAMEAIMDLTMEGRNTPVLPEWRALVEEKLAGLARGHEDIVRARVTITKHPRHLRGHDEVLMTVTVPGELLTVQRTGDEAEEALFQACEVMAREVKSYRAQRHRTAKSPGPRPRGVVATWFPDRGYGFIRTEGDREVYLHRRSVTNHDEAAIALGAQVEFELEEGEKGPQAARVTLRR